MKYLEAVFFGVFNGNTVICFYKISLMCPDMNLELSIHQETAHSDGSFLTETIHISTIFLLFPSKSNLKVAIPFCFLGISLKSSYVNNLYIF